MGILFMMKLFELFFHLHQNGNLINKPVIDHGDFVDGIIIQSLADGLGNHVNPLIVHLLQPFL